MLERHQGHTDHVESHLKQASHLSQIRRAMLRVIEYFTKSLKVSGNITV